MATVLRWPHVHQGTSGHLPVTPVPAETLRCRVMGATMMGATMMGATVAGPGTAVWGAADHGQRPRRVALVAMVGGHGGHAAAQPHQTTSSLSTAPKGRGSGDVPGLSGLWGCVP